MRRLLLLRHAKAAPPQGRDDHGRALTDRGRREAGEMGEAIAQAGAIPDVVLYSSAARTRQTAEIVASGWARPPRMMNEHALYDATRAMILSRARALPDDAGVALIVGHNPGIGDLANQLAGAGGETDRTRMAAKYPTSALAILDFPAGRWEDISLGGARLAAFLTPADASVEQD